MDGKLPQLVEELTTSGEPRLDPAKLKELKKMCKSSDEHITHVYHLLMTQLNQEHAEIRLSAFQVVDELFTRSHQFRTLIISNFQEFLELTVETDYDQPLPPPVEVAQKLKRAAIKSVQEWHEKYGEAYKKLSLGFHFLKQNKKVDFQDTNARTLAERKRDEEKQKRLDNIYKEKAKKAEREMADMSQEIKAVLTEMENCFQLLMPDPFDFMANDTETVNWRTAELDKTVPCSSVERAAHQAQLLDDNEQPCCSKDLPSISLVPKAGNKKDLNSEMEENGGMEDSLSSALTSAAASGEDDYATFVRSHGLGSHKYSLNLEIATDVKLQENEDNTAIINNAMDAYKLIRNKFMPSVQSWIQLFTRAGINDEHLRQAIDLKNKLERATEKCKEMNIGFKDRKMTMMKATDDSDEEDEFVDVPEKEGYEPYIPDHLRNEYGLEPVSPSKPFATGRASAAASQPKRNEEELDPTCAAATWKMIQDKLPRLHLPGARNSEPGAPNNKSEEEKAKAPVVPFGLDLFYWGQEQPDSGKIIKCSSQHRFWAPSEMEEEVENKEVAEMLKSRYITFAGKFEPVKHKCRAPMPSGGLCERQDRFKCPFHGKIIPRDDSGTPIDQEDREREAKQQFEKKEKQPEWQDPEFMREVEAATGVDLGSSRYSGKGGKKKGKKKKYANLTDLKQQANTSRSRLEKKVFDKTAMKRVVKAMNRMDQRKHEKFANQFNYALN
ncbi:UV-stimulated scaffold protein A isoform X1 [Lacerta agilis]|uniref:UV-stimulated scaffold protein A isoform X1 n=1 Tax=Lacerta agilis TaxID=80427 RepID=UPI001419A970|nr:UV-stimulated scaffold protein A isoform X1 [Lacerta agilis]